MKNNQHFDEIAMLTLENNIEAYKASSEFSHALNNRAAYGTTSLMIIILMASLFAQRYVLETWVTTLMLSLILLGVNQYMFRGSRKIIYLIQESQLPKMSAKNDKINCEGLKLFMLMSNLHDAMKVELKVVWFATLVLWSSFLLTILSANASHTVLALFASVCAAPALVSIIYGTTAMCNLTRTSHISEVMDVSKG